MASCQSQLAASCTPQRQQHSRAHQECVHVWADGRGAWCCCGGFLGGGGVLPTHARTQTSSGSGSGAAGFTRHGATASSRPSPPPCRLLTHPYSLTHSLTGSSVQQPPGRRPLPRLPLGREVVPIWSRRRNAGWRWRWVLSPGRGPGCHRRRPPQHAAACVPPPPPLPRALAASATVRGPDAPRPPRPPPRAPAGRPTSAPAPTSAGRARGRTPPPARGQCRVRGKGGKRGFYI